MENFDEKFYSNFRSTNTLMMEYVFEYFNEHIWKGNDDIEYRDVWFHTDEVIIHWEDTEIAHKGCVKVPLQKFLEYMNTKKLNK